MHPKSLDVSELYETLRSGQATDDWLDGWLSRTYEEPARFHEAAFVHAFKQRGGLLKSRYGEGYDFYHDIVLAQLGRGRTVIVAKEAENAVSLTFEQLHERCSALLAKWRTQGLKAGQSICLVQRGGVEHAVALLAALRMGLVVSVIPVMGATLIRECLDLLAADYVVASELDAKLLGSFEDKLIRATAAPVRGSALGSHLYAPEEPVLRLVSPFGEHAAASELSAASVHASLLRDACIYALNDSDVVAAPGFDTLQFQPILMLTVLAAGATWVELEAKDIENDPTLIRRHGITVLGMTRKLRDARLHGDIELTPRRSWFRSLTEVQDHDSWERLARSLAEKNIPGFAVVANAATGGTLLFSPARPATSSWRIWPAPGQAWQLSEVAGGKVSALNDVGVFTPSGQKAFEHLLPQVLLSRDASGYAYHGSVELGPDAQRYPKAAVLSTVHEHVSVRHADIVMTAGRYPNEARIILLLFVESHPPELVSRHNRELASSVRQLIAQKVGEAWIPDRVEVIPLRPRLEKGAVDSAWSRSQYLSGTLEAKARSELFVALSKVGYLFSS